MQVGYDELCSWTCVGWGICFCCLKRCSVVDPMAIGPSRTLRVSMNQKRHTCYGVKTYSIRLFLPFRPDRSHIRYLNRVISSIDGSRGRAARCSTKRNNILHKVIAAFEFGSFRTQPLSFVAQSSKYKVYLWAVLSVTRERQWACKIKKHNFITIDSLIFSQVE